MTKESVPVCGAKTRAGTSCQNTLVTGCGRCPVHASQLRAAAAGVKPVSRTRSRKKKPARSSGISTSSTLSAALAADGLLDTAREQGFQDHALSAFSSAISCNIFGVVQDAFATPLQGSLHEVKHQVEVEEMSDFDAVLRKDRIHTLDSPVTPATEDNSQQRFDFVYPTGDGSGNDAISGVDVLGQDEDYLESQLKVNFDELVDNL